MLPLLHMAAVVRIPLQEYRSTSCRPDCEYVDGEVRNVGKWEHARVQWLLALWFGSHEKAWGISGSTEQRIRVSERRVRLPDPVVLTAGARPYGRSPAGYSDRSAVARHRDSLSRRQLF